jgi:uncharacterized protein (TIGR02231 family)
MAKGVLNAETLSTVTDMVFKRHTDLATMQLKLSEEALDINKQLGLLRRKRSEITRSHSNTVREAHIYLDKAGNAKGELRLSYVVNSASWSPVYNVRGTTAGKAVAVELGALVHQASGEDWEGVDLTLSTAGAQMIAYGPTLAPLKVALSTSRPKGRTPDELQKKIESAKQVLASNQLAQQTAGGFAYQRDVQWNMNEATSRVQMIELGADPRDAVILRRSLRDTGSGLAVNYTIGKNISLVSRRESQLVQITKLELPASFHHEATPILDKRVFRYAEVTNNSETGLLEGKASVYLDGRFVGTTNLPMVAGGQRVLVGFGTNPQLRTRREFVTRSEKGQLIGGNKEVQYTYRLILENYSEKPVTVRLMDRIPVETDDISVKLTTPGAALAKDVEYKRSLRPKGILRWDVDVPAKAAQGTAKVVEYAFTLEFDEDMHIALPAEGQAAPAAEDSLQEFDKVLEGRFKSF